MPCNVVQGLPGETSQGNENHRPVLPLCDRQTGFKRMVQENANGEKHNRQHYEENEAKLASD